jgi:PAS domain S-box-containing protein
LGLSTATSSERPISFAGDRDFPPIEYLEQDIPKGLNVDLLRELSKAMGRRIDIRLMPWEEAQKKVLSGEIDAITTMSITDKRKELYDFSEITLTYQYSFFVKTGQIAIKNPRDLEGKAVAVTRSGLPSQVLPMVPGIKFVFIEDYLEGFRLLLSQEIDAVAADRWVGAYTLQKNDLRGITIIEKPFAHMNAGIAVKKGNTKLLNEINLAIKKLKNDGTIKRIEDKWSPEEILFLTREQIYEKAAYVIVTLLIVVIGAAFFWILSLRKANNSLSESRRIALNLKDEAIDARRLTEQALKDLRQSQMDLNHAQEVGQIGWWRIDTRNLLTWSDENHRIFGVLKGTPLTYETFLGFVYPDDRYAVDTKMKAALASEPYDIEHRILVDGKIKWVREKAFIEFDDEGKLLGCFGITQDITERKKAENILRKTTEQLDKRSRELDAILSSVQDNVYIFDSDGRFVFANKKLLDLWGLSTEQALGKTMRDLNYPETVETALLDGVKCVFQTGEVVTNITHYTSSTGVEGYYENILSPIHGPNGKVAFVAGSSRDITMRKLAEQELRQLNDTLEAKVTERTKIAEARARQLQGLAIELIESEERERRRFADLLHNDLQQMLASARFQLQAASRDLPNEPVLANITQIIEETLAKSRRLSQDLSPPILHHGSLYSAFGWLVGQMSEQFGLEVHLEADEPPQLENGSLKVFILRAVQEILFNTVKHSGVKSARVMLSSGNDHLEIVVSDQGKGFDKAIIDSALTNRGFGLLSIRERAHYMGGRFRIESTPGQGARFFLKVPNNVVLTNERQIPLERPLKVIEEMDFSDSKGLRVLFADDHKVMREGLIRLISGQPDIQVVGEAANGREALELTLELKPNLVIMDINMPEMDGIEATRLIKATLPEVRVIGLSMHDDVHISQTMRDAGADGFVIKTASSAELLRAIYGTK